MEKPPGYFRNASIHSKGAKCAKVLLEKIRCVLCGLCVFAVSNYE